MIRLAQSGHTIRGDEEFKIAVSPAVIRMQALVVQACENTRPGFQKRRCVSSGVA
jgi:hypothetical protein